MARLGRGPRKKRLVLDIGTSAIRLAELAPTKAGLQLTRYSQRELTIDPSLDEEEKAERRQEVLSELLKEAKIRTRKTIVAVPGQSVFTRNRPLPPVPEHKVTQIVRYEIQQQIPFSLDQIALDYQVLDRTEAGGYDVMMAAIKVDVVEKQLDILRSVKRSIDTVDVSPIAAYNWLSHTGDFGEDGQCIAMVDMGATTTDIVIQKDNQFKFTRSLHVGANDITTAIASNFNMTFEEAERLKREKGFAPTGDPKRDGRGGEVIGRVLNRLVGEINRSFAYFRSQPGGGPVQRVIVTGGGACLRNIIPYLQRQLGIEVRIAQPLAGLAIAPKANEASEYPEQACVVLGLALRCCDDVPIQINLVPPRVLEVARRKEQAFYWFLSLATMYLILASIIPVTAQKNEQVQDRIKGLEQVLARYDASLLNDPEKRSEFEDDFDIVNNDIKAFKQDITKLDNMKQYRNPWLPFYKAIAVALPTYGGIKISALESMTFGGQGNTGIAQWKALENGKGGGQGGAGGEEQPEEQEDDSGGRATLADLTGGKAGLGGLAALGGGGGRGGGGASGDIIGFQGLQPHAIVEPNGFSMVGYAENVELVKEFERNLKESGLFLPESVYLHEDFLHRVPDSDLQSAMTNVPQGSSGGGGSGRSSSGGGGGFAGLQALAGSGGGARGAGRADEFGGTGAEVVAFHIDVQFMGKPFNRPKNDAGGNNRSGGGRGGGGLGGLGFGR